MKTSNIIAVALAATLYTAGLTSCGDDYDDSSIKDSITALDKRVTALESAVNTLQNLTTALQNNDYATKVEKIEGGYKVTFAKSGEVIIKDGKDGATPAISAKAEDGVFYWTVNGEFLKVNDEKVPTAQAPVAVEDEADGKIYWQLNGEWMKINNDRVQATGDQGATGEQGPGLMAINEDGTVITFTIDGTEYKVNVAKSELTISEGTPGIMFIGEENTYTVAIPAGWEDAVVRADVASNDDNKTAITRAGSWASFRVDKTTNAGMATIKATPTGFNADDIAELTVTMINGKEKLVGSIFVAMAKKTPHDFTTGFAGDIAAALTSVDAPVYYNEITISGTTAMNDADWAALAAYPYAKELTITSSEVKAVPANALEGNKVLTTFTGHSALVTIGANAFTDCVNLETLTTMTNVTSVGEGAFQNCAKIADAGLGALTALGANAFNGCTALATVPTLGGGITELPEGVFAGTALASVTLADITAIGDNAFKGCTKLEAVTFAAATSIGASAFEGAAVGGNWTFGGDDLTIGAKAFAGCNFGANTLAFSATSPISSVEADAFEGATVSGATVSLKTGSAGSPVGSTINTWANADTAWATVTIN